MHTCNGPFRTFVVLAALSLSVGAPTVAQSAVFVPPSLSPGDTYHLVFASSTLSFGFSSDNSVYDAHVQAAADAAGIGVTEGVTWSAIVSTPDMHAFVHIPTFDTSDGLFNMNGDLVATDNADLWDGSIAHSIAFTETGAFIDAIPWTGTAANGFSNSAGDMGTFFAGTGRTTSTDSQWVQFGFFENSTSAPVYGISSELIVSSPASGIYVPEPGTAMLALLGLAVFRAFKKPDEFMMLPPDAQ